MDPSRRKFLKRTLGALALAGGAVGFEQRGEADALTVTRVDVPLPQWPAGTPGLRVGQLSDMHCDGAHAIGRTKRAVDVLLAQKPDVVFLTGDYISYKPHKWARPAAEAMAGLTAVPGGVYAVLGNHDWWGGGADIVARELTQIGIHVLRNESVALPQAPGVWVVGLDDRWAGKQDVVKALQGVPDGTCRLMLMHEPDYADEAPPGFALQFSGHSHAGQIRLPGLPPLHCPQYGRKYPEGLQQALHHPVYTSRGVGTMGPHFRLFCPPEIGVLHLHGPTL
jgi:predicted MPP superfamily phosphohydrolase